jgi:outer membrane lipopolysaccharide assembly protein LptE/RlpB
MIKNILTIVMLMLLSSCGFTIRGYDSALLSPELQQLQLSYNTSSNELAQILRRRLMASGVEIVEDTSAYNLILGDEQSIERIISVNRNVRAGEYEITLTASMQLDNNGESLIAREIISVEQIYEADPNNAAAKTNEAEIVMDELRLALSEQIMRRLQTIQ